MAARPSTTARVSKTITACPPPCRSARRARKGRARRECRRRRARGAPFTGPPRAWPAEHPDRVLLSVHHAAQSPIRGPHEIHTAAARNSHNPDGSLTVNRSHWCSTVQCERRTCGRCRCHRTLLMTARRPHRRTRGTHRTVRAPRSAVSVSHARGSIASCLLPACDGRARQVPRRPAGAAQPRPARSAMGLRHP
ncbi:hypothetical protein EDF62_1162 [Leucobacter luti]|uniref:Uncharacterized protein n=1 Tax=Leucobacter luti TaxID=340320 RepID=A0A4R6S3B9_9MICO|nr:hypothetical protein EDF62_1162 [Leucobacter luti]